MMVRMDVLSKWNTMLMTTLDDAVGNDKWRKRRVGQKNTEMCPANRLFLFVIVSTTSTNNFSTRYVVSCI